MDHVGAEKISADLEPQQEENGQLGLKDERSEVVEPRVANDEGEHGSGEAGQQRIERLGRERPEKLKSVAAEILFCYCVIASQFMAVSCFLRRGAIIIGVSTKSEVGILCVWFQRHPSNSPTQTRYPTGWSSLALSRLCSRHGSLPSSVWSALRQIWRLSGLYLWIGMVLHLVCHHWLLSQ